MPEVTLSRSRYSPASVGVGIVHIGLGAFHRAHQALYIENWLNRNGGGEWGICAANVRSNAGLIDQIKGQHYRFHVAAYTDSGHVQINEINSIRNAIFAGADKRPLLEQLAAATTKIVTLTVTEKAYCLSPASGMLLVEAPDIAHDIEHPDMPGSVPGLLVEALRLRRDRGIAAFSVLSCDNMPDNGGRTKQALSMLAAAHSSEFAAWIDAEVACPSSMVDRIVPAATADTTSAVNALLGFPDPVAVTCESFCQWVIEDHFPLGRPDWETEGVQMVADVGPFETMKLRLLNGAHSLLAYVGLNRGMTTVAAAVADPGLQSLVNDFFAEAGATLDSSAVGDIENYTAALLERFGNDALDHRLSQIAMDGSQKIPQRWLEAALINLEQGRSVEATATAIAAWISYVRGNDNQGRQWRVEDPLAEKLADCHSRSQADETVDAVLDIRQIFSEPLSGRKEFRNAVRRAYRDALR